MISPWVCGLRPGDETYVTIYECGVPVWRRGTVIKKLLHFRWRVLVDGAEHDVHQHDLRSVDYAKRNLS